MTIIIATKDMIHTDRVCWVEQVATPATKMHGYTDGSIVAWAGANPSADLFLLRNTRDILNAAESLLPKGSDTTLVLMMKDELPRQVWRNKDGHIEQAVLDLGAAPAVGCYNVEWANFRNRRLLTHPSSDLDDLAIEFIDRVHGLYDLHEVAQPATRRHFSVRLGYYTEPTEKIG